jgi:hypothetical protein
MMKSSDRTPYSHPMKQLSFLIASPWPTIPSILSFGSNPWSIKVWRVLDSSMYVEVSNSHSERCTNTFKTYSINADLTGINSVLNTLSDV